MTEVLNTTKPITPDDLIGALERYGMTIVTACAAQLIIYLCSAGAALRAFQGENGFCYFGLPDNCDVAWANAGQREHHTTSDPSEPNNTELPVASDHEQKLTRLRQEAGRRIDPETAEVTWQWGQTLDPYGILDLPKEKCQVQRNYFARSPGSEVWVHFADLPEATRKILSEKAAQDILPLGKVARTKYQA